MFFRLGVVSVSYDGVDLLVSCRKRYMLVKQPPAQNNCFKEDWKKDFQEGQCGNDLGYEVGGFLLLQRTIVRMTISNCSVAT